MNRASSSASTELPSRSKHNTANRENYRRGFRRDGALLWRASALVAVHQRRRFTYRELKREVDRFAKGLLRLGVSKGERVGVWSPNNYQWVVAQFATAKIGAILVNINPAYRVYELEYVLKKADVRTLILAEHFKSSDYVSMFWEVCPETKGGQPGLQLNAAKFPTLREVILIAEREEPGMLRWDEVAASGEVVSDSELDDVSARLQFDEPINIQYTSGTTGFPKGVMLSHHNIVNNGFFVGQAQRIGEQDRICIPVPFYHCFGTVMSNMTAVCYGAAMILPSETFDPRAVLETVEAERCTTLQGVPTMFIAELNEPDFARFDLSSLRTGIMAGAPCPIEVVRRVISEMHMPEFTIAYGQTETSPVITQTLWDASPEARATTVGLPAPYVEIKIINPETGEVVPHDEQGEICARGYTTMLGYWDDAEATAQTIDAARWVHTGDLGTMDGAGYVRVTGRLKDMIIRGGENIYPREIEEFLYTHPSIADVQVVGVAEPKYGEEVIAWIKLAPGHAVSELEVREYCTGKIAHYKIPRYVRFVDDFPTTISGKVQKFKLREMACAELGLKKVGR